MVILAKLDVILWLNLNDNIYGWAFDNTLNVLLDVIYGSPNLKICGL